SALAAPYRALVKANKGSANLASWTADANTVAAGLTMPQYDAIAFATIGIVGQPSMPWQNRPTFQQVVSFPAHRPADRGRTGRSAPSSKESRARPTDPADRGRTGRTSPGSMQDRTRSAGPLGRGRSPRVGALRQQERE